MKVLCLFFILFSSLLNAQEGEYPSLKEDTFTMGRMIRKASYIQFTGPQSWAIMGVGLGTVLLVYNNDKKLLRQWDGNGPSSTVKIFGDYGALFLNLPFFAMGLNQLAKHKNNPKLYHFSLEYAATAYLTLPETYIISAIPIHKRPSTQNQNFVERYFRLKSSFPSGHMAAVSSLFFKTLQYYGPLVATPALAMAVMTATHRMQTHRHWPSDVIGTFFLGWLASEGTRMVHHQPQHYDRLYRFIYRHQLTVSPTWTEEMKGLRLSMAF